MFSSSDYDKLQQIMEESPEKKDLLSRLLESHQMTISSISHEIRNPLTLIYSTLQLIASQHPETASFKHWDQLMKDVEYTNQLLQELSSYNNSSRLTLESVNADTFFKTTALSFAVSVLDTDIQFVSQIEPGLPEICCDTVKLRQVLLNLLRNAKDAVSSPDCNAPEIRLEVRAEKHHKISVTVCDNGCGMTPEQKEHIFEPFTTYKPCGTGLGLAIADRIVRAHKGLLTVSSVPGGPTIFAFSLPVQ